MAKRTSPRVAHPKLESITGQWDISAPSAVYRAPTDDALPYGVAVSDAQISDGILRVSVSLKAEQESGRLLFGYSAEHGAGFSVGLGGYERKFVLQEYFYSRGSRLLAGLGRRADLIPDRAYELEARIFGNSVTLLVDGIEVINRTLPGPALGRQIGLEAYGPGGATFRDFSVTAIPPRAFVIMQFGDPYDSFFREVIRPVAKRLGIDAYRADDVFRPGIVLQDIVDGIRTSRVVIAEVTPQNPNVYYELGYAHATGTPTILLAEEGEEGARLPFDISGFRCIFYRDAIRGKRKVETELEQHLRSILGHNGQSASGQYATEPNASL